MGRKTKVGKQVASQMLSVLVKGAQSGYTLSSRLLALNLMMDFSLRPLMLSGYIEPCDMALALCAGFLQVPHSKESSKVPQKQLALLRGKFQMKKPYTH